MLDIERFHEQLRTLCNNPAAKELEQTFTSKIPDTLPDELKVNFAVLARILLLADLHSLILRYYYIPDAWESPKLIEQFSSFPVPDADQVFYVFQNISGPNLKYALEKLSLPAAEQLEIKDALEKNDLNKFLEIISVTHISFKPIKEMLNIWGYFGGYHTIISHGVEYSPGNPNSALNKATDFLNAYADDCEISEYMRFINKLGHSSPDTELDEMLRLQLKPLKNSYFILQGAIDEYEDPVLRDVVNEITGISFFNKWRDEYYIERDFQPMELLEYKDRYHCFSSTLSEVQAIDAYNFLIREGMFDDTVDNHNAFFLRTMKYKRLLDDYFNYKIVWKRGDAFLTAAIATLTNDTQKYERAQRFFSIQDNDNIRQYNRTGAASKIRSKMMKSWMQRFKDECKLPQWDTNNNRLE